MLLWSNPLGGWRRRLSRACAGAGIANTSVPAAERSTPAFAWTFVVDVNRRLSKRRGQWQQNAPAICPMWDPAFQRGEARPHQIRARRHIRRSESRESCGDDLDVVCAALGLHQRELPQVERQPPAA
jgi:hypothetical protein